MKDRLLLVLLAASTLCFSCGPSKNATRAKQVVLDTITVSAKNNPLDIYRASEPMYWDIIHTRLALSFNMKERTADGRAWVSLRPYFYPSATISLNAQSMRIDSVLLGGSGGRPLKYSYINDSLNITLDRVYHRTDSLQLYVKYTAMPYATLTGGSKAITDDRGLYFINTDNTIPNKPSQIWTQGETEANSHWIPTIDQPNERFTTQLELTIPDSLTTLSNGALVSSIKNPGGMRTDTWRMDMPIQTYAIMMAIGKFSVVQDEQWQGKEISYYVEPAYAPYAKKMFNNTPEMVDFFSKITGVPFPWNKYSQVVVRDYVSGAMENTTASLFGEFMNQNFREIADKNYEDIVSHELFHQWFGDYVTAESWSNLTVNESFATYGEHLWRLYKYGKASTDELAFSDLGKYLSAAEHNDDPLVRFHYHGREDMFDRISYQKGAAILNYLHKLIGDSAFYNAMNVYLTDNALQAAEAHHWRLAVEEVTGLDWNWFFNQWYYRGGHPTLKISYDHDDQKKEMTVNVRLVLSDSGKAYRLPLKAALIYDDSKEVIDWVVDEKQQTFTYPYRNGVRPVFVPDQEHWLVGVIQEKKPLSDWLVQLVNSDDYINKRRAVSTAFVAQQDTMSQVIYRTALRDSLDGIRTHVLNLMQGIPDKYNWQGSFRDEVSQLAVVDPSNRVRAAAFEVLGSWKVKTAKPDMLKALSDSSYMVAGAALEALRRIDKDTAYVLTKRILTEDPKAELESAAWSVVALKGNPEDIRLFAEKGPYVYGTRKISLANYLNLYNMNTKDLGSFEQGIALLLRLTNTESIKSYRLAVGSILFKTTLNYKEKRSVITDKEQLEDIDRRIAIAEEAEQQILSTEPDPENVKAYRAMRKGAY